MTFRGFTKETIDFFNGLAENNNKQWFESNRKNFEDYVMTPAKDFVVAMGERLKTISPDIQAIPKTDKSIFRIHRDTRFSKDKRPYKTHLGIFFWEGQRKKMECSGYYFHLEPPNLMIGVGLYIFPPELLKIYRESVDDKKQGGKLVQALKKSNPDAKYTLGGQHYKQVPREFDKDHPRADLMKHNGLYLGTETKIPSELFTPGIIDYCFKIFSEMSPLHKWLVDMTNRAQP